MRQSIFDIENRLDMTIEFGNFIKIMNKRNTIIYDCKYMSLFSFFDNYVFSIWSYRDTFIDLKSYLDHIAINNSTYDSIQTIVNKMRINHPVLDEPYKNLSLKSLMQWYDKCFKLMIYLIRCADANEINKERNKLVGKA